jgi:GT2 family glycosyltransferase
MTLARLRQLLSTAHRVLQQRGILTVFAQGWRWLRGERGYATTLSPDLPDYAAYRRRQLPVDLAAQRNDSANYNHPRLCIVTLDEAGDLRATAASLASQTWQHFDWLIVTEKSIEIDFSFCQIVRQLPDALPGDYVAFVDAGDRLPPHALYTVACHLRDQQPDMLYTDCDSFDESLTPIDPFFKPGWSPEMLFCVNYVAHLLVIRCDFFQKLAPYDHLWAMVLRAATFQPQVVHVPQVLYHRCRRLKQVDTAPLANMLRQKGLLNVEVRQTETGNVHPVWQAAIPPKIAVIIPNSNQPEHITACLEGLFQRTDYPNLHVIVVDTASSDPRTLALYQQYRDQEARFTLVENPPPFNFSRACNQGAAASDADVLLFLNNDTRVLHEDWLWRMVQWLELPEVGIVGAKLLYPSGQIQHSGVILGMSGLADHVFAHAAESITTPYGSDGWIRNYLAVTGACLMIRRTAFEAVGGFDEQYELLFSDVGLCLSVHAAGWRIVYTPHARLIHHEAATHQRRMPHGDLLRASQAFLPFLQQGDPYYNPNLTVRWRIPLLNGGANDHPLVLHREALAAQGLSLSPETPPQKSAYPLDARDGHG